MTRSRELAKILTDGNLTGTLDVTGIATFTDDIIIGDGKTIGSASDVDAITIASNGVVTFSQAVSGTSADFDGGITVDNITIDGTEIDLSSGDLTIDVAGDISIDAGGGDTRFKHGGTEFLTVQSDSSLVIFKAVVQDKDIQFRGNDGGVNTTMLTLDASDAGTAIFNHDIKIADNNNIQLGSGADLFLSSDGTNGTIANLTSNGDLIFQGNDGGSTITALTLDMSAAGMAIFSGGVNLLSSAISFSGSISTPQTAAAIFRPADNTLAFSTANNERMRIESSGRIGIGTTAIAGYRLAILTNGSAEYQAIFKSSNTSGTQYHLGFNRDTTQAGHLTSNVNNQVALNNGSDYRLKENISDMTDGIERVKQLQPKKFSFLSNPDKEIVDGFLAHEVKDLVPYSVLGEKDAVDKEGEPVMQTIDITALIPVLTGAIKELIAKVETLEAEVKSLKGN